MINGYSIRKCAQEVKISIPTSFYWRHKILDAIRAFMGIGSVGGVVEVDEAFLMESFKGDHKKSTAFTMPRKAHKSYIQFAQNIGVELQQIKRGKHKEGIYHIQHINAFHSKLKKWMDRFNGVATKYLSNYMYWFKWLEFFNTEKDTIKSKNLLVQSHTAHSDTKLKDFRIREAIYV